MLHRHSPVEHLPNLRRDVICCYYERRIQMHVSLRDAASGVAKQTRDRELGEPKVAGNAGKGMPEDVRRYILELRFQTNAVEDSNHADEMAISPIGRKEEPRTITARQRLDAVHRSFS